MKEKTKRKIELSLLVVAVWSILLFLTHEDNNTIKSNTTQKEEQAVKNPPRERAVGGAIFQ
ncbi:hypothetical protein [Aquitalea pelogenes]|uniref:hypothetical protein n=1 Tax=Aquitalea pelogenes TaxID=1293573 RepID=UPI0035AE5397